MRIDEYGTLVMEHVEFPGNVGDSCAETSKLGVLVSYLQSINPGIELNHFFTFDGWVRHPKSPWREDDMPTDQLLPLYLAAQTNIDRAAIKIILREKGWRLPNGDLIHPIFYAFVKDWRWLIELCLAVQVLFFKFPIRWNDGKKLLEWSSGSSCDYSLWLVCALQSKWAYRLMNPEKLYKKIQAYYWVEPNVLWVLEYYRLAIRKKWETDEI